MFGISSFKGQTTIDFLNVTGVTTTSTLAVSGTSTTRNLVVSGVTPLGFVTVTNAYFICIVTAAKFVGSLDVSTLYVTGISTFLSKVNINNDLGITGLTTTNDLQVYQSSTLNRLKVSGISTFDAQIQTKDLSVSGIATFANTLKIDGSANKIYTSSGNLTLDSSGGTTQINDSVYVNDTTESTSQDTGSFFTEGGVGIEKNLFVGGSFGVSGISTFDDIKIENNVISTLSTTNTLYLDPYPDGLSNEGTVIIKGNLQVDGTTTSVNSINIDINDPIIILGDVTSIRTVMTTVVAGVSTIRLDSVTGINTGDVVSGNAALSLSGVNTVTAYNTSTKVITLQDVTVAPGISTTTQLTITHAFDTSTDRGVGFNYNTSSGTLS